MNPSKKSVIPEIAINAAASKYSFVELAFTYTTAITGNKKKRK